MTIRFYEPYCVSPQITQNFADQDLKLRFCKP